MVDIATCLRGFGEKCPTKDALSLNECAALHVRLVDLVGRAAGFAKGNNCPAWMATFVSAGGRFINDFAKQGREWIKKEVDEKGVEAAGNMAFSCSHLSKCKDLQVFSPILVQAAFLSKLQLAVEPTSDFSELTKRLKHYVSINTLDRDAFQFLMPQLWKTLNDYQTNVGNNIIKVTQGEGKKSNNIDRIFKPFRLGSLCHSVSCFYGGSCLNSGKNKQTNQHPILLHPGLFLQGGTVGRLL